MTSPIWLEQNVKQIIYICQRCQFRWNPKVKEPKVCPKCKSYKWKEEK